MFKLHSYVEEIELLEPGEYTRKQKKLLSERKNRWCVRCEISKISDEFMRYRVARYTRK
jgi:hypothetical protein